MQALPFIICSDLILFLAADGVLDIGDRQDHHDDSHDQRTGGAEPEVQVLDPEGVKILCDRRR